MRGCTDDPKPRLGRLFWRTNHCEVRRSRVPQLQTQHRLARDTAAVKFVRHLRDLLEGRLRFDLRMKPLRRNHRDESRQSLRGRTMRKLVEQNKAVEASPTGPHEGGRVERCL